MSVERTTTTPQGNRRIDRVLAEDYLAGLGTCALAEVRERRAAAEQEEVDLSYSRRLIQGRLDIVGAELQRRDGSNTATLVEGLVQILADDDARPAARGLGRHSTVEPSNLDAHVRYVEALVADVDLSDVGARTAEELISSQATLAEAEVWLSANRRLVQSVMDACSAEITRRYKEGEADVSTLLDEQSASPS